MRAGGFASIALLCAGLALPVPARTLATATIELVAHVRAPAAQFAPSPAAGGLVGNLRAPASARHGAALLSRAPGTTRLYTVRYAGRILTLGERPLRLAGGGAAPMPLRIEPRGGGADRGPLLLAFIAP